MTNAQIFLSNAKKIQPVFIPKLPEKAVVTVIKGEQEFQLPAPAKIPAKFYSDFHCDKPGSLHRSKQSTMVKKLPANFYNGFEIWGVL